MRGIIPHGIWLELISDVVIQTVRLENQIDIRISSATKPFRAYQGASLPHFARCRRVVETVRRSVLFIVVMTRDVYAR